MCIRDSIDASGKLYSGQHGVAMEVGHIIIEPNGRLCGCGNQGCMEQYASASGVSISYFNATTQQHTAAEIARLAKGGDQSAIAAYELAANANCHSKYQAYSYGCLLYTSRCV